jgi:hypothetical protein
LNFLVRDHDVYEAVVPMLTRATLSATLRCNLIADRLVGIQCALPTIRSASGTRSSPEISFGKQRVAEGARMRVLAKVVLRLMTRWLRRAVEDTYHIHAWLNDRIGQEIMAT